MWIFELFCGIFDLITEIQYAKRFGWGDFWLNLAGIACLLIAISQFADKHYILGIIAIAGWIFCTVKLIIRFVENIRSAHEYNAWKQEQEKKKKS